MNTYPRPRSGDHDELSRWIREDLGLDAAEVPKEGVTIYPSPEVEAVTLDGDQMTIPTGRASFLIERWARAENGDRIRLNDRFATEVYLRGYLDDPIE